MKSAVVSLATASIVGLAGVARGQAFLKAGDEILCVGDSITEQGIYERQLEQALHTLYPEANLKVVNLGKGGAWAGQQVPAMQAYLTKNKPTIITAMFGVNDTKWDSNGIEGRAQQFVESLRKYPPIARQAGAELIFLRETDFAHDLTGDDFVRGLSRNLAVLQKAQTAMAAEAGIPIIDCHGAFKRALGRAWEEDPKWEFTPDIIHPHAVGHAAVTGEMLRAFGAGMELAKDKRGALNLKGNPNVSIMVVPGTGEVAVDGKVPVGIEVTNRNEKAIQGTLIVVGGDVKATAPVKVAAGEGVHVKLELPVAGMKGRWDVVPLYMAVVGPELFAADTNVLTLSRVAEERKELDKGSAGPVADVSAVRTKEGLEVRFAWKDTTPVPAQPGFKNRFGQAVEGPVDLNCRGAQPCDAVELLFDTRDLASTGRQTANVDGNPKGVVRVALYKAKASETVVTRLYAAEAAQSRVTLKEEGADRYAVTLALSEGAPVAFALRATDREKFVPPSSSNDAGWMLPTEPFTGQQIASYFRMGKDGVYYRIGW